MEILDRLDKDLKDAILSRNSIKTETIRAIKTQISVFHHKNGIEPTYNDIIQILSGMIKTRENSISIYDECGRDDLADIEREEVQYIKEYMPIQLTYSEIKEKLSELLSQNNISNIKQMGLAMKLAKEAFNGTANNADISKAIKELIG